MKNNQTRFIVLFTLIAVLVFAASVALKGRSVIAPAGDTISISSIADGDEVVANATAGYYFLMPPNWYVEKNASTGLMVYPDYDPKSGTAPDCKLAIYETPKGVTTTIVYAADDDCGFALQALIANLNFGAYEH